MLVTVVETDAYFSKAAKFMSAAEMEAIVNITASQPTSGDIIQGTRGLRKMRVPLQGRGKRGGGRVIYWLYNELFPAVLFWAFAKNEASDLTSEQRKILARVTDGLINNFGSAS
jgi:hypothetical protein